MSHLLFRGSRLRTAGRPLRIVLHPPDLQIGLIFTQEVVVEGLLGEVGGHDVFEGDQCIALL